MTIPCLHRIQPVDQSGNAIKNYSLSIDKSGTVSVYAKNRRATMKNIQRITSQQTSLSTNHVRAFRPFEGSETGFNLNPIKDKTICRKLLR